jgi:hypothetical protein
MEESKMSRDIHPPFSDSGYYASYCEMSSESVRWRTVKRVSCVGATEVEADCVLGHLKQLLLPLSGSRDERHLLTDEAIEKGNKILGWSQEAKRYEDGFS